MYKLLPLDKQMINRINKGRNRPEVDPENDQSPLHRQLARHLSTSVERTCVRFRRMIAGEATFDQGSESLAKGYSVCCRCRLAAVLHVLLPACCRLLLARAVSNALDQWSRLVPFDPIKSQKH